MLSKKFMGLFPLKMWNKVQLGSYIVENVELDTAKVRLGYYIVKKAKLRYGWDFNVYRNAKIRYSWGLII